MAKELAYLGVGVEIKYLAIDGQEKKDFSLLCKKCEHTWPVTPRYESGYMIVSDLESSPECSCSRIVVCEI